LILLVLQNQVKKKCQSFFLAKSKKEKGEIMPYFRITWEGYQDIEAENENQAKECFIRYVVEEELDRYGRDWKDLIGVEELEDEVF